MNAVLNLIQPYYNSNRSITVENFLTSFDLADQLWENKITLIGTENANKNFVPESFLKSKH